MKKISFIKQHIYSEKQSCKKEKMCSNTASYAVSEMVKRGKGKGKKIEMKSYD